jgi:hypothetical protein
MNLFTAESQRSNMDYRNKRYCGKCNHFKPLDEFQVYQTTSGQGTQKEVAQQFCRGCAHTKTPPKKTGISDGHQQAQIHNSKHKLSDDHRLPSSHEPRPDQWHSYDHDRIRNRKADGSSPVTLIDDIVPLRPAKLKEPQVTPGPVLTQSQGGEPAVPTFNWFTRERAVKECQTLWLGLEHSNTNLRQLMDKNAELQSRNLALLREMVEVQSRAEAAEKEVERLRRGCMTGDHGMTVDPGK